MWGIGEQVPFVLLQLITRRSNIPMADNEAMSQYIHSCWYRPLDCLPSPQMEPLIKERTVKLSQKLLEFADTGKSVDMLE